MRFNKFFCTTFLLASAIFLSTSFTPSITFSSGTTNQDAITLAEELAGTYSVARGYTGSEDPKTFLSLQMVHFVSDEYVIALHKTGKRLTTIRCDFLPHEPIFVSISKVYVFDFRINGDYVLALYKIEHNIPEAIPFKLAKGFQEKHVLTETYKKLYAMTYGFSDSEQNYALKAASTQNFRLESTNGFGLCLYATFIKEYQAHNKAEDSSSWQSFLLDGTDISSALIATNEQSLILIGVACAQTGNMSKNSRYLVLRDDTIDIIRNFIKEGKSPEQRPTQGKSTRKKQHKRVSKRRKKADNENTQPPSVNISNKITFEDKTSDIIEKEGRTFTNLKRPYREQSKPTSVEIHKEPKKIDDENLPNIFDNPLPVKIGDKITFEEDGRWVISEDSNPEPRVFLGITLKIKPFLVSWVAQTDNYTHIICETRRELFIYKCGRISLIEHISLIRKKQRDIYVNGWEVYYLKWSTEQWSPRHPSHIGLLKKRECYIDKNTIQIVHADDKIETIHLDEGYYTIMSRASYKKYYPHKSKEFMHNGSSITRYKNGIVFTQQMGSLYPIVDFDSSLAEVLSEDFVYSERGGVIEKIYCSDNRLELKYPNGSRAIYYTEGSVELWSSLGQCSRTTLDALKQEPHMLHVLGANKPIDLPRSSLPVLSLIGQLAPSQNLNLRFNPIPYEDPALSQTSSQAAQGMGALNITSDLGFSQVGAGIMEVMELFLSCPEYISAFCNSMGQRTQVRPPFRNNATITELDNRDEEPEL